MPARSCGPSPPRQTQSVRRCIAVSISFIVTSERLLRRGDNSGPAPFERQCQGSLQNSSCRDRAIHCAGLAGWKHRPHRRRRPHQQDDLLRLFRQQARGAGSRARAGGNQAERSFSAAAAIGGREGNAICEPSWVRKAASRAECAGLYRVSIVLSQTKPAFADAIHRRIRDLRGPLLQYLELWARRGMLSRADSSVLSGQFAFLSIGGWGGDALGAQRGSALHERRSP